MPSNVTLNDGTGTPKALTKQVTHDGDTAQVQGVTLLSVVGTEDSYTASNLAGQVDVAASAAQPGIAALVARDDALGTLTEADGDLTLMRTNARGAVWAALDSSVALPAGTNNIGDVDVLTCALPTGASTAANQTTVIGHLDGVEALLTTIDADTGAIMTAVQLIDNAISGSEMQVDVVAALPTGANTIGAVNIAAAQTLATVTTVGAVTTVTNPVTVVGAAAEDAAASGNPVLIGGRYDSSARTLETGDVGAPALNASGQLLVEIAAGAGSGGTAMADGATFTRNTTSLTPAGAMVETSAPTLTNGDIAALSQTTGGALRVAVASGGIVGAVVDDIAGATAEGILAVMVRDDTLATLTPADGDYTQGRTNARGAQWVCLDSTAAQNVTVAAALPAGTANIGDVDIASIASGDNNIGNVDIVTLPALATGANVIGSLVANQSVNVAQINGVTTLMGNGASGTGAQRVTIANDSTGILASVTTVGTVTNITNQGQIVDNAAFTDGTTRVTMAGFLADEASTGSVAEGDGGASRMTLDRKLVVTEYVHAAAGGTSLYSSISTAAVLSAVVKASPGKVWAINVMNLNAAARYVRLYNQTGAPGSGDAANILWRGIIPGATTGAGFTVYLKGAQFSAGIGIRASAAIADNDTTVLAANELVFNVEYV